MVGQKFAWEQVLRELAFSKLGLPFAPKNGAKSNRFDEQG
jgi:hypothetical protein